MIFSLLVPTYTRTDHFPILMPRLLNTSSPTLLVFQQVTYLFLTLSMYRDNRGGGGSSYRGNSSTVPRLGSLSTPSFSSITMLNKPRGNSSSWESSNQGFGSSGNSQPWGSSGNDRGMGGGRDSGSRPVSRLWFSLKLLLCISALDILLYMLAFN